MRIRRGEGRSVIVAIAAALAVCVWCAPAAEAAFPGKPGEIVFAAAQPGFDRDLFVLTPGREPVALTDTPSIRETDPAYSPSGRLIAYTRDDGTGPEIWIMNADGSGTPHFLTDGGNASSDPAFSADGSRIAYNHFTGTSTAIFVMNANGSDQHQLVPGTSDNREPAFSPNGRLLAYRRLIAGQGSRIFVVAADGEGPSPQLTDSDFDDFAPAWLPDSRRIVFHRSTPTDSARSVWIMKADGSGERALTSQAGYRGEPAVAPDASRFLFLKEEPPLFVLLSMPLRGGPETPLTQGVDVDGDPDWRPVPVRCGGRTATLVGTPRADRLIGTRGRDVITGLGGRDRIRGRAGNDVICGGGSPDRLNGGDGRRDRCIGGPRHDRAASCERRRSI